VSRKCREEGLYGVIAVAQLTFKSSSELAIFQIWSCGVGRGMTWYPYRRMVAGEEEQFSETKMARVRPLNAGDDRTDDEMR
jgi:hypothetical protein